jgi:DNA-binding beta-propeller fold protein YncE
MTCKGTFLYGVPCLALAGVLAVGWPAASGAAGQSGAAAPAFTVEPFWPQPLPEPWILGSVTGVAVDARDHVWVVHRGMDSLTARTEAGMATDPPTSETCCAPAPFVLEFDPSGALAGRWGGPGAGYDWPHSPGAIRVDGGGHVWIAGTGAAALGGRGVKPAQAPPDDAHVLKFSRTGEFLLQIGKAGEAGDATSRTRLRRPASIDVDLDANEVFVADAGNDRIVVFDAANGEYKRQWALPGATCVRVARDGSVYGCDRQNNRLQVSRKDGTVVKEAVVGKGTRGEGAVWDVAFSPDPEQRFLYVADGSNQKVWILDRASLSAIGSVGAGGRWPGHFFGVGSVAVDSKGNLYTGETYEGKRVQKFVPQGRGGGQ